MLGIITLTGVTNLLGGGGGQAMWGEGVCLGGREAEVSYQMILYTLGHH